MKRDQESQKLFESTVKDISNTFKKAYKRGFGFGLLTGFAVVGIIFMIFCLLIAYS